MNILPLELEQALINCIERKQSVLITQKKDENWQFCRTVLTSMSFKNNITTGERSLTYGEKNPSGEVGVSFRQGHYNLIFCSSLQGNALAWPTKVMKIPRRAYNRRCPKNITTVRFWTQGCEQIYGQLEDISTGGMRVSTRIHKCGIGSYTCAIDIDEEPITADAILRGSEVCGDRETLSFQFVGLEFNQQSASRLIQLNKALASRRTRSARTEIPGPWH